MTPIRLSIPSNDLNLAIGEEKVVEGTPIRRFRRYVLQVGQVYKKKGWPKPLNVDESRASHFLSVAEAMLSNGRPIKATSDHSNFTEAKNCMGDAVKCGRDGEWMYFDMDIRGKENIKIAEQNKDCSVEIYPQITDGKGNTYRDAIAAITFTPIPVVTGQPIAASMADDFYSLSTEKNMDSPLYLSIAKLGGVDVATLTDEAIAASVVEGFIAKLSHLQGEKSALEQKVLKLSQEDAPDTRYLSLEARNADNTIDNAVRTGIIDVNTANNAKALISNKTGDSRQFTALALSLSEKDEAISSFAENLVKLLAGNKPVKTGEGSGVQLLRLVPDADEKPAPKTIKSALTGKEISIA